MRRLKGYYHKTSMAVVCAFSFCLLPMVAEAASGNIGEPGPSELDFEWWGAENQELNPNGRYAYYVDKVSFPEIKDVIGGHNINDDGNTSADYHMVVFAGNFAIRNIYGGYSSNGNASNNIAIIYSGTVEGNAVGGYAYNNGNAIGNKLIVYGGNFTDETKSVSGGQGFIANENTVIIYGGNITNEIDGGVVMEGGGTANNNTVVIAGNFSGTPYVWGGTIGDSSYTNTETVTGNTLEVRVKNQSVKNVGNFENYYFILPAGIKSDDTVLNVLGSGATVFQMNANIGVAVASGAQLNKGDKVTLIKNTNGFSGNYQQVSLANRTLKGTGGVSLKYGFTLSDTPTTIDATVTSLEVNEQAKAIVEARAASVGIANTGADLVAGQAMANALANTSAKRGMSDGSGTDSISFTPFSAVSGGTQRLESGSYVDVNGISGVLGIGAQKVYDEFTFTGGPFFEFGTSHFRTHNSFSSGNVDGKGHARYYGGGLLARFDFTKSMLKDMYFEGSFRFGNILSDWHSDDLRDEITNSKASYDMNSPYIGAHVGAGYVWKSFDSLKLDFYGKFFWTRVNGKKVSVIYDLYDYEDVDSYRLRLGMRADKDISELFGIYGGAAWEHEFDGKAKATVYGFEVPAPSVQGNTGIFDFGFSLKPKDAPGLTMELGGTATAGIRRGIMGNLKVKYVF